MRLVCSSVKKTGHKFFVFCLCLPCPLSLSPRCLVCPVVSTLSFISALAPSLLCILSLLPLPCFRFLCLSPGYSGTIFRFVIALLHFRCSVMLTFLLICLRSSSLLSVLLCSHWVRLFSHLLSSLPLLPLIII